MASSCLQSKGADVRRSLVHAKQVPKHVYKHRGMHDTNVPKHPMDIVAAALAPVHGPFVVGVELGWLLQSENAASNVHRRVTCMLASTGLVGATPICSATTATHTLAILRRLFAMFERSGTPAVTHTLPFQQRGF